jgi:DNA-binding CsgD family transcriptional regulator
MRFRDRLSEHLDAIYATADQSLDWGQVLELIASDIDAKSGIVSIDDVARHELLVWETFGFSEQSMADYADHYAGTDVWALSLADKPTGQFFASHELASEQQFLHSEFRHDWAGRIGMRHATGAYLEQGAGLAIRVAFQRESSQGYFEDELLRYLNGLAPHIHRAAWLGEQVGRLRLETSYQSAEIILLLDRSLRIHACSSAAQTYLADSGTPLTDRNGRLTATDSGLQSQLQRRVSQAISPADGAYQARIRPPNNQTRNGVSCDMTVIPYRSRHAGGFAPGTARLALLRINQPRPQSAFEQQARLWQLSTAEQQVLQLLLRGMTSTEISEQRCRSIETVRSQIKSILRKSNHNRLQSLLVSVGNKEAD